MAIPFSSLFNEKASSVVDVKYLHGNFSDAEKTKKSEYKVLTSPPDRVVTACSISRILKQCKTTKYHTKGV